MRFGFLAKLSAALTIFLLLVSCVDESYSISNFDENQDFNVGGLIQLPIGSVEKITLGSLLDLGETDFISLQDNGDIYLNASWPLSKSLKISSFVPNVDPVGFTGTTQNFPFIIPAGFSGTFNTSSAPFSFGASHDFSFTNEALPKDLTQLKKLYVDATADFRLMLGVTDVDGLNVSACVTAGTTIDFPSWMEFNPVAEGSPFILKNGHTLELKEDTVISEDGLNIELTISAFDFSLMPEDKGLVAPGKLDVLGTSAIAGSFYIIADVNTTSFVTGNASLEFSFVLNSASVKAAEAKFDFSSQNFSDDIVYEISYTSDFMKDSDIALDLRDLRATLDGDFSLPISGSLSFGLSGFDDQDNVLNTCIFGKNGDLRFNAISDGKPYFVSYCFSESGLSYDEHTPIAVPGLDRILNPLPSKVSINNVSLSLADEWSTVYTDVEYGFDGEFGINTPLFPGKDFHFGLSKDIELEVPSSEVSPIEIELSLDLINTIPLGLELNVVPLTDEGQPCKGVTINLEGAQIAAGTLASPVTTPIKISLNAEKGCDNISALSLTFSINGNENGSPLNEAQGVELRNISISLLNGLTVTL